MRKHAKRLRTGSLMRGRRFQVIGVVAVVVVVAIAATAISMQASKSENAKGEQSSQRAGNNSRGNSLALRSTQDGQTFTQAQIRPLTQEEAQQLAEGIKNLVNQSTDGLKQVQHMDGSVSLDLEGRFQSVAVAKRDQDGKVIQSCVDNRQAAAAFFGIDPQLVGVPATAGSSKTIAPVAEKGGNQ